MSLLLGTSGLFYFKIKLFPSCLGQVHRDCVSHSGVFPAGGWMTTLGLW